MAGDLRHRGPDDGGLWTSPRGDCALAHRRLAIIDLSPAGHQPMVSASGRYILVFNGEIYNYRDLAVELEALGHRFRGHSDTEVLLAACDQWGLVGALERANGMFALALWDESERRLALVRDRLGEKPLYWAWVGGLAAFASEPQALRRVPGLDLGLDRAALASYLRHAYIPAPYSVYREVHKLPPATWLSLDARGPGAPIPYWDLGAAVRHGRVVPFAGSAEEAVEAVQALLTDSIRLRMHSDVPVGAFLSGGIDSSTVVALMQTLHPRPVETFTIGFEDRAFDEAPAARAVAEHLGTRHHELYVTHAQALAVIPRLPEIHGEPFADVSQIPTFLVSEMARREVTVSLSGDGGDELFCGYNRYLWGDRLWSRLGLIPVPLRRLLAGGIATVPPGVWQRLLRAAGPLAPAELRQGPAGDKLHKLAEVLRGTDARAFYLDLVSTWKQPGALLPGVSEAPTLLTSGGVLPVEGLVEQMMYLDTLTYLPDDILTKVDRASMAVSLEVRVPMLDHRLVELAWTLPLGYRYRGGVGKWPLRTILGGHVPQALWDRPKMGFGVPIGDWLRGPLRDWAEHLLDPTGLSAGIGLDPTPIREAWAQHLSGRRNLQYYLWPLVMLQAWLAHPHD